MLDALFKRGSKARQVAQLLLSGEARTRKELAERADVSATTIPRVINALESVGVEIETKTDKSREVTYHVAGMTGPSVTWTHLRGQAGAMPDDLVAYYTAVQGDPIDAEVLDSEKTDGVFRVTLMVSGQTKTGVVEPIEGCSIPTSVVVGGPAKVMAFMYFEDGEGLRIADDRGAVDIRMETAVKKPQRPAGRKKVAAAR